MPANNLVIHIPHASTHISDEFCNGILLSKEYLAEEILWSTDLYCDELFDVGFGVKILADFSRLVCDVERFRNDDMEPNAKTGIGFFYTHTQRGRQFRESDDILKGKALELYDRHHERLTKAVDEALAEHNICLIVDGHSFCNDRFLGDNLPDFCIGADEFHTPALLIESAQSFLENIGYSVAVNYPYSGSIVSSKHYKQDKRVLTLMIEINKRLYLDDVMATKSSGFIKVREDISELIKSLLTVCSQLNSFTCQKDNNINLAINDFQAFELCSAIKAYRRKMEEFHTNPGIYADGKINSPDAACAQSLITGKLIKHLDVILSQIYRQWPDY